MAKPKEEGPLTFPYKTLDAGIKDGFKKLGGPEEALRFMTKGYKNHFWRKRHEASIRAEQKLEAPTVKEAKA